MEAIITRNIAKKLHVATVATRSIARFHFASCFWPKFLAAFVGIEMYRKADQDFPSHTFRVQVIITWMGEAREDERPPKTTKAFANPEKFVKAFFAAW